MDENKTNQKSDIIQNEKTAKVKFFQKLKNFLQTISPFIVVAKKHFKKRKGIYSPFFNIALLIIYLTIFIFPLAGAINTTENNELNLQEATTLKEKIDYLFNSNQKRVNAIIKYGKRHGVPPLFATAVIFTESTNKTLATSYVNARGLMQLMSKTAVVLAEATGDKKLAAAIKKNPNVLYDADINIFLGTYFLKDLKRQYRGNWSSALHAYNVGPYAFKKGKRNPHYVNRIMRFYSDWKNLSLPDIHEKYSAFLFNLYSPGKKLIGLD